MDLAMHCLCGEVRGQVHAPDRGNRVICYCDDCQLFAHFLDRADDMLDAHGGSDVIQMSPAQFQIDAGKERLACMRLGPKGLLRWYADCCRTAIANTIATRSVPLVSLLSRCIDAGATPDTVLGPVRARILTRFARGTVSGPDVHEGVPVAVMLRIAGKLALWRLTGGHRQSVLFDAASAQPIVEPRMLTEVERAELQRARRRWVQATP